jgi:hypothetical protein
MDIKILKAGQSGYGYLIENDAGYISPDEPRNKNILKEFKKIDGQQHENDCMIVYVVLQKFGVKNKNGRIYPEKILKTQNEIYQDAIRQRRALGELDHPETSVISGDRISHNIIQTWWEGHTLMGKMEIPMTKGFINFGIVSTKGDLVAHYLQQNYMIGVSSRGVGSLKEVGDDFIVQSDFEIICWDIVTAPSTPGSWMFKQKEDARPYVESISIKKSNLHESLDNFLLI